MRPPVKMSRTWITPARAGKTAHSLTDVFGSGDHPRSCGKDFRCRMDEVFDRGSPPLVRERLCRCYGLTDAPWITPARAGKTSIRFAAPDEDWDHPRSCGKDQPSSVFEAVHVGSPPLVRERRRGKPRFFTPTGITPARAGKTAPF